MLIALASFALAATCPGGMSPTQGHSPALSSEDGLARVPTKGALARPTTMREATPKGALVGLIPNRGQWDNRVRFLAQARGVDVWITTTGITYDFHKSPRRPGGRPKSVSEFENQTQLGHVVQVQFEGGSDGAQALATGLKGYRMNFLRGNNSKRWVRNVPVYSVATVKDVYKGIDLAVYFDAKSGRPRYDFVVHPGADLSRICMRYRGAEGMRVEPGGALAYDTSLGKVEERDLIAYQSPVATGGCPAPRYGRVDAHVKLNGERVTFAVGKRDPRQTLVLDPVLWSTDFDCGNDWTFFGGNPNGDDKVFVGAPGNGMSLDSSGNVYLTSVVSTPSLPTTYGAYQRTLKGTADAFVVKFAGDGSGIDYATFVGGSSFDYGEAITVDSTGAAYVSGMTNSSDFPVTAGAFQTRLPNGSSGFAFKLSPNGSQLVYSTYIGGTLGGTSCSVAALDARTNELCVGGSTSASDYPIAGGLGYSFRPTSPQAIDGVMTKLTADGKSVIYSTFLSSGNDGVPLDIAVDATGSALICGLTGGNLDTTPNAYQRDYTGGGNAFVGKLAPNGGSYAYLTYLGGSNGNIGNGDGAQGIAVDADGSAYVVGQTSQSDFPTTAGSYMPAPISQTNGFLAKFGPDGSLVYSTYLGGQAQDYAASVQVDAFGQAYVFGGYVPSYKLLPAITPTPGAIQPYELSRESSLIWVISAKGDKLIYGSYLGGSALDYAWLARLTPLNQLVVTGVTYSLDFPTSPGSFEPDNSGQGAFFLAKLDLDPGLALQVSVPITAGGAERGTVYLPAPAPKAGAVVTLSADDPSVSLPAAVKVPAGASSATFNFSVASGLASNVVDIEASYNGMAATRPIFVTATSLVGMTVKLVPQVNVVTFSGTIPGVYGGEGNVEVGLTLNGPAPVGGYPAFLTSTESCVAVPSVLTVPAGQTSATFTCTTSVVNHYILETLTAPVTTTGPQSQSFYVVPVVLSGLTVSTTVFGEQTATGKVTLETAAPPGGLEVTLTSSDPAHAKTPASVVVPAGATSATFSIATGIVAADEVITITAIANGFEKTANLTVKAYKLKSLAVTPTSVVGGSTTAVSLTVTLTAPAPVGGVSVALSSSSASASVPATAVIPAGQSSVSVPVTTTKVAKAAAVTLKASLNGGSVQVTLKLTTG